MEVRGFIPLKIIQIPDGKIGVSARDIQSGCRLT